MSNKGINVMIADDHVLVREGLKQLLELETDIDVIQPSKVYPTLIGISGGLILSP